MPAFERPCSPESWGLAVATDSHSTHARDKNILATDVAKEANNCGTKEHYGDRGSSTGTRR